MPGRILNGSDPARRIQRACETSEVQASLERALAKAQGSSDAAVKAAISPVSLLL